MRKVQSFYTIYVPQNTTYFQNLRVLRKYSLCWQLTYKRHFVLQVDAGADVIVTQLFYYVDNFLKFVNYCRLTGITWPTVLGIMPINNYNGFIRKTCFCKKKLRYVGLHKTWCRNLIIYYSSCHCIFASEEDDQINLWCCWIWRYAFT